MKYAYSRSKSGRISIVLADSVPGVVLIYGCGEVPTKNAASIAPTRFAPAAEIDSYICCLGPWYFSEGVLACFVVVALWVFLLSGFGFGSVFLVLVPIPRGCALRVSRRGVLGLGLLCLGSFPSRL